MAVSYPRRQQLRRLRYAALRAAGAAVALVAAVLVAGAGEGTLAPLLVLLSGVLALASRRALRLSARSRMGARSEAHVRRALEPLRSEGWRVQHALDWPGTGDLDHVVRSPAGFGFLIETKTRRYTPAHVRRAVAAAGWLARRRRHYPAGVRPVICVVRARAVEAAHGGVLIVSPDRLVAALRAACPRGSRPC
jgi:Nuclease-related domain